MFGVLWAASSTIVVSWMVYLSPTAAASFCLFCKSHFGCLIPIDLCYMLSFKLFWLNEWFGLSSVLDVEWFVWATQINQGCSKTNSTKKIGLYNNENQIQSKKQKSYKMTSKLKLSRGLFSGWELSQVGVSCLQLLTPVSSNWLGQRVNCSPFIFYCRQRPPLGGNIL